MCPQGLLHGEPSRVLNAPCERVASCLASGHDEHGSSERAGAGVCVPGSRSLGPLPGGNAVLLGLAFPPARSPFPSREGDGLLRGEGSLCPATDRGFTMGMHLFIRAGFIFMEKLLWAGVVLGESAGLLPHARSCHRRRSPGRGICFWRGAGFPPPAPAESVRLRKHGERRARSVLLPARARTSGAGEALRLNCVIVESQRLKMAVFNTWLR